MQLTFVGLAGVLDDDLLVLICCEDLLGIKLHNVVSSSCVCV